MERCSQPGNLPKGGEAELEGGVDSYPVASFAGPLKVLDSREFLPGCSVPREFFARQDIRPGDVVVIYTEYEPPQDDETLPQIVTSRRIPLYEGLFNVNELLERDRMFFVGVPVNIRDGDGMIVPHRRVGLLADSLLCVSHRR